MSFYLFRSSSMRWFSARSKFRSTNESSPARKLTLQCVLDLKVLLKDLLTMETLVHFDFLLILPNVLISQFSAGLFDHCVLVCLSLHLQFQVHRALEFLLNMGV